MQLFMSLHGIFDLLYIIPFSHAVFIAVKHHLALTFKTYTWKERKNQVTRTDFIKQARLTFIRLVDLCKQVYNMIRLPEVVQNVIIFSMNAKLFKFVLESAGLLKKTEDFVYLNIYTSFLFLSVFLDTLRTIINLPSQADNPSCIQKDQPSSQVQSEECSRQSPNCKWSSWLRRFSQPSCQCSSSAWLFLLRCWDKTNSHLLSVYMADFSALDVVGSQNRSH